MPSAVHVLGVAVSPSTIRRLIVSIIVDSVKCAFPTWGVFILPGGYGPILERLEGFLPLWANGYTASAVIVIILIVRVAASFAHTLPNGI